MRQLVIVKKKHFFDSLNALETSVCPVILGGDFNCVEDLDLDKEGGGGSRRLLAGSEALTQFKNNHQLVDTFRFRYSDRKQYTFEDQSNNNNTQIPSKSRLDRIYIPTKHTQKLTCNILNDVGISDHKMVVTSFTPFGSINIKKGKSLWRLNIDLLEDMDYITSINSLFDELIQIESQFEDIFHFWEIFKGRIKIFTINFEAKKKAKEKEILNKALLDLSKELEKPFSLRDPNQIKRLKDHISQLRRSEISKLLLESKLEKIESDEKPSVYFYKRMQQRKEKSTLEKVFDEDKNLVTDPQSVLNVAKQFYQKLYTKGKTEPTAQDTILSFIDKKLSVDTKQKLEADLTLDDLKKALKNTKNGRTTGLDELPYEFYKKFSN